LAGLTIGGGCTAALWPAARAGGWPRLIPTAVLVRVAPAFDRNRREEDRSSRLRAIAWKLDEELDRREAAGVLDPYWGVIIDRYRLIRTRQKWPRDVPLAMEVLAPPCANATLLVTNCKGDSRKMVDNYWPRWLAQLVVEVDDCCQTEWGVQVAVEVIMNSGHQEQRAAWSSDVWRRVRYVDSVHEVIAPVRHPGLTALLRSRLRARLDFERDDEQAITWSVLRLWADLDPDVELGPVACPMAIELCRAGEVVAHNRIDTPHKSVQGMRAVEWSRLRWSEQREYYFFPTVQALPTEEPDDTGYDLWLVVQSPRAKIDPLAGDWTLRVSADPMLALIDWDFDQYWAGSFEISVRDLLEQSGFEFHEIGQGTLTHE
jgi:hypothetical protein